MRRQRRHPGGVSFGTIVALTLTGLVIVGCVFLFPKLMGDVQLRVDAKQVAVALDSSLRMIRGQPTAPAPSGSGATPATAPPLNVAAAPATPTSTPAPVRSLTLTVGGAISVDTAIQKTCTSENGYAFNPVFEALSAAFRGDIRLATLENLAVNGEKLTDINMPSDALNALSSAGVNVLCNGFPNALDIGFTGLKATLDAASATGITVYGVYPTQESRSHVTVMQAQNMTIAFLSFQNDLSASGKKKTTAEEQAFAVAPLTLPEITDGITRAHTAGAQLVIVSLRWGKSGASEPTASQKELAQGIADAGADIILGTGSGVVQTVETLTGTRKDGSRHKVLCAYSLGNLLTSDRSDRDLLAGTLLHVEMAYDLAGDSLAFNRVTYTPTFVWRDKLNGKTAYRVIPSNENPPSQMSADQSKVMARCRKIIEDLFDGFSLLEE